MIQILIVVPVEIAQEEELRYLERIISPLKIDTALQGDQNARALRLLPNLERLRIKSPWLSKIELSLLFTRTLLDVSSQEPRISSRLKSRTQMNSASGIILADQLAI